MKTCETCMWYVRGDKAEYDRCSNPSLPAMQKARETREIYSRIRAEAAEEPVTRYCEFARMYADECGAEGRFWEAADAPPF